MRRLLIAAASATALCAPAFAQADDLSSAVSADYDAYLEGLYQHFHANPELSMVETETAARLAEELRQAGFDVTEDVGAPGLVGVLENGDGPTVLLRADMDGLPMEEDTPLDFASEATQEDRNGNVFPVMHACAHDTHMTALVGAARWFSNNRDAWSGKLILIGQPGEEIGLGSHAMLEDGLYERFGTPDAVVSFHTWGYVPAGEITFVSEYAMANVDSVDITVRGIGAHGASPQNGVDPIVLASQIVTNLQTLVSREISPFDTGVVTVGAFNAGTKHNIIPDSAHLQLTVRSYEPSVRQTLLDGIERIAMAQARAAGLPDDLMPIVETEDIYTPALYNDPALTQQSVGALRTRFGEENVRSTQPVTGGEDFARYGMTEAGVPIFMFWVGGQPRDVWDEYMARGEVPPANHSPFFYPDAETSITMATEGMAAIALDIFENGVQRGAE